MAARILIADDHALMRYAVGTLLRQSSFMVCGEARDGREAVEMVVELRPDLVIMDLSMPVMNGLEAATEIRRLVPGTKILVLTMHDSPMMQGALQLVGVDGFLLKTANSDELLGEIRRLLGMG